MEWTCPSCGRRQVKRRRAHVDGICEACLDAGVHGAPSLFDAAVEPSEPTPAEDLARVAGDPARTSMRARHRAEWPALWVAIDKICATVAAEEGEART